jgi:hypothetical protein
MLPSLLAFVSPLRKAALVKYQAMLTVYEQIWEIMTQEVT